MSKSKVKIFSPFDPPVCKGLFCEDASLTRQEFVQEADINNIMKRYAAGSPLPSGQRLPLFDDFSDIPDPIQAFNRIQEANERFYQLPSNVREYFNNDPAQLLAFCSDVKNRDKAIELGLISKLETSNDTVSVPVKGGSQETPPTTTT